MKLVIENFGHVIGFLCLIALIVVLTALAPISAYAQGLPDLSAFEPVLAAYIEGLAGSHGWIVQVLTVMATLRVIFKPLMPLIHAVVSSTGSQKDDEILGKVEKSVYFKVFSWLLDFGASIKIDKQEKKK